MKIWKALIPAAILLLLMSGCYVQSLHPYYTDDDLVKDDALLGSWIYNEGEKQEEWTFESTEDNSLILRITKQDAVDTSVIHTFELGGVKLMDFYPGDDAQSQAQLISAFQWIPVHLVAKYEVNADTGELAIYPLSIEWLKDMALRHKLDIEYTVYDKNMVLLTADTEKIREFILDHLDEAFSEDYGRMVLNKKQ